MAITFQVKCPKCGQALMIEHEESDTEAKPEDRMHCPTHGDVGAYIDFEPAIREEGLKLAKAQIDKIIRGEELD